MDGITVNLRAPVVAMLIALAGCEPAAEVPSGTGGTLRMRAYDHPDALRVARDSARDRAWVLHPEHIDVYAAPTGALIRRVVLPPWSVVDGLCGPDIAFDRAGAPFISHQLEPKLWRIDPETFEVEAHAIRLVGRETLDVGFGRLAFAADGALYGVTSAGGWTWRIDLETATAERVDRQPGGLEPCVSP